MRQGHARARQSSRHRVLGRGERGAAAVEFALVAPLLLLIVFAIISYGVMFSFRQGLSQAAAEGARAAALAPATPTNAATFGAAAKARAAVAAALGSGYSCSATGNLLVRGTTTVGSCTVTSPAACTAGACTYSVRLVYRYEDHPLVPTFPFVPVPDELVYVASAQGNG